MNIKIIKKTVIINSSTISHLITKSDDYIYQLRKVLIELKLT